MSLTFPPFHCDCFLHFSPWTENSSPLAKKITAIITRILDKRTNLTEIHFAVKGDTVEMKQFLPLLIHDKNQSAGDNGWSYQEFLRHAHHRIMDKMAQDRAQKDLVAWEMLGYN